MLRRILTLLAVTILVIGPISALAAPAFTIPTFSITAVTRNVDVTIKTSAFPAGEVFTVTMGAYGTAGIGGILVKKHDSGSGGTFNATFNIPASLKNYERIAIRLYSPTSGYYAFNWFWNYDHPDVVAPTATPGPTQTPGGPTATPATPAPSTSWGFPPKGRNTIPSVIFKAVVKNTTVKVQGSNFTTNDKITVYLNDYGTLGVGGPVVGTVTTNGNGAFTETFNIPAQFQGDAKIAIRLVSKASGYYAYDWFYNNAYP